MLFLFFDFRLLFLRLGRSPRCLELELAVSNLRALFVRRRRHDLCASKDERNLDSFVLDRLKWTSDINAELT